MKKVLSIVLVLLMLAGLAACGGGKTKTLTVIDGAERTEVTVKANATVAAALAEAGIIPGEKDEVTPALDEKPADGTEIEFRRFVTVNVVTADGTVIPVEMTGGTVADALKAAGVTVAADESVNINVNNPLYPITGDIVISKVFTVKLTADGKTEEYQTGKTTVADFLNDQGIEFTGDDRLTPAADEKIEGDTEIVLQRVEKKTETVTETIPFETKQEYSSSLDSGKTQTKQSGADGEKEVTYQIILVDGEEESREILEEKVIKEAVSAIIVVGTKKAAPEPETGANGKVIVSKVAVPDCDDPSHGYYVVTYEDGSVDYVDY